jgi:hypothetical protein
MYEFVSETANKPKIIKSKKINVSKVVKWFPDIAYWKKKHTKTKCVLETKQERVKGSDTKSSEYICLDVNWRPGHWDFFSRLASTTYSLFNIGFSFPSLSFLTFS